MPLLGRKSEEEKAAKAARKEQARSEAEERKRLEAIERARADFFASPAGKARVAFGAGEQVFQYAHDVTSQKAIVVAMVGSATAKQTSDPSEILNSVCHEGWELVNGSFVFVHEGSQSRDKFMSSGQNLAVKGTTVGYYLFRRCEVNRREVGDPWDTKLALDAEVEEMAAEELRGRQAVALPAPPGQESASVRPRR
jgi:hypothetical protein